MALAAGGKAAIAGEFVCAILRFWASAILVLACGINSAAAQMFLPVPVPVSTDAQPFRFENASIVSGISTRTTVTSMLGSPHISDKNGHVVVYARAAIRKGYTIIPGDVELTHFYFVVELDPDGVVQRKEVISGEGCTTWRRCIVKAKWSRTNSSSIHPEVILESGEVSSIIRD